MSKQMSTLKSRNKKKVVVKVGMVGDSQIGKTSLMVKYVEGQFNEDYIQTLGVNFMEKTIALRNTEITFSIWDLGGQQEYLHMLPLVCNDAVALLFMFDLSRKSTLTSVKNWYTSSRHTTPTDSFLHTGAEPFHDRYDANMHGSSEWAMHVGASDHHCSAHCDALCEIRASIIVPGISKLGC